MVCWGSCGWWCERLFVHRNWSQVTRWHVGWVCVARWWWVNRSMWATAIRPGTEGELGALPVMRPARAGIRRDSQTR